MGRHHDYNGKFVWRQTREYQFYFNEHDACFCVHIHFSGLFATQIVIKGDIQARDGKKEIKLNWAETGKLQFGYRTGKDGFFFFLVLNVGSMLDVYKSSNLEYGRKIYEA